MTDARLPDRWLTDRRLLRLTDPGFRLFVNALVWSVANKTDGELEDADLPLIPAYSEAAMTELAQAGLWIRTTRRSWLITDFGDTQSSRDELDALAARRRADRQRKARSRDRSRDGHAESVRLGQARQGKDPRDEVSGKNRREFAPDPGPADSAHQGATSPPGPPQADGETRAAGDAVISESAAASQAHRDHHSRLGSAADFVDDGSENSAPQAQHIPAGYGDQPTTGSRGDPASNGHQDHQRTGNVVELPGRPAVLSCAACGDRYLDTDQGRQDHYEWTRHVPVPQPPPAEKFSQLGRASA